MENKKKQVVRIELNDEQKHQIREATGKELDALEFEAEALEERITPLSRRI